MGFERYEEAYAKAMMELARKEGRVVRGRAGKMVLARKLYGVTSEEAAEVAMARIKIVLEGRGRDWAISAFAASRAAGMEYKRAAEALHELVKAGEAMSIMGLRNNGLEAEFFYDAK